MTNRPTDFLASVIPDRGTVLLSMASQTQTGQRPKVQPCRYKTGKTLGAGSYSVVKECVHIDTGRYYAAKVINKRLMAGREHMVFTSETEMRPLRVSVDIERRLICGVV